MIDSVLSHAIVMLDAEGRVIRWSAGAEKISGYASSEILGQSLGCLYLAEEAAAGKPARDLRLAVEARGAEFEHWRVRRDGMCFWASVAISPVWDESGELAGFTEVTRDLSERKRVEEANLDLIRQQVACASAEAAELRIRQSEEQYRALSDRLEVILQGIADGITVQDRSGRLVYANQAAAHLCGAASSDILVGMPFDQVIARFELFDERGAPVPLEALPGRAVLEGRPALPLVVRLRERASRRDFWTSIRASAVRDGTGAPALVINILHDVTATQKQVEAERCLSRAATTLSESLDHPSTLRALAELLVPDLADWCAIDLLEQDEIVPVAIAHRDPAKLGVLAAFREALVPTTGKVRASRRVVRTGRAELHPELTEAVLAQAGYDESLLAMIRELGLRSAMVVPLAVHGQVFGTMTLVTDEGGRRYDGADLALAEELGRRAGVAIEHARLFREAQLAIRLRDEFLSVAGHELKTPLAALSLQLHSLDSAFEHGTVAADLPRWAARVRKTIAHGRRLERLISELLDVGRISAGRVVLEREDFELGGLVTEIVERHAEELARSGSPLSLVCPAPVLGHWDRSRLDQVITNLLGNAVKYGLGRPIEVVLTADEGWVELSIRDEGIGVKPEDRQRIFERFERAVSERNYGGFGLGLWIVRALVEAHGGSVTVDSDGGRGSKFTVVLPRTGSGGMP